MKNIWHKSNYIIWDVDITPFKNTTPFDVHLYDALEQSFLKVQNTKEKPPESNGLAYSAVLKNVSGFTDLVDFLSQSLNPYLENLNASNVISRSWANRMHRDSYGSLHKHGKEVKVFILYYNVPPDSSDLVLVHPKYQLSTIKNPELIPAIDRQHIKVNEGTCILHDGDILHGVSKHNSDYTRDAIIIEFLCK